MLVKELFALEDCDQCPFYNELCSGGWTYSYGGTPIEPRCTMWNDNDDVDELYRIAVDGLRRYEEAEERRWQKEEENKKKKEERNKKARDSRWAVRTEQREITSLRKRIRNNNKIMSFARSFAHATNFANEAFGYTERVEVKNNPLEAENEKLQARIDELILIKKKKLKQLRKENKI
jgi:hypothetical protein